MIQPFTPTLFFNHCFDKRRFQHFIYWFFRKSRHGHSRTLQFLEKLKSLGFQSATEAGFSISIEDLKIPLSKSSKIFVAENIIFEAEFKETSGCLTAIEKSQQILEIWNRTSERLKHQVLGSFQISDFLNPVYLMAFSGARGNISQIRQLIGMRGLMADPQGQIVDFPIRSNFREGLTLTEYLISCSGARKGIVDTALRTAASGYLTRRLVDVAHHVIIGQLDCQTSTGIVLEDLYDQDKKILTLKERLIGRILAENIYSIEKNNKFIGFKNQEITQKLSFKICQYRQKVFIRSPLTCQSSQFICQLCYGWNLAEGQCVSVGEAIGILAAQSIGEPGTQLTMRTFHTGGVFTGSLTDQTYAPLTGHIYYPSIYPGLLTRTQQGQIAFLTKKKSVLKIFPRKEKFLRSKRGQFLQRFFSTSFSKFFQHRYWKKNQLQKLPRKVAHAPRGLPRTPSIFSLQFQNQIQKLSFKLQRISSISSITSNTQKPVFKKKEVSWILQASTLLYVRQGETVEKQQLISEVPSYTEANEASFESEQEILSSTSGEIFFENFIFLEKTKFDSLKILNIQLEAPIYQKTVQSFGEFWILFGHVLQTPKSLASLRSAPLSTFLKKYDLIGQAKTPCSQILIQSESDNFKVEPTLIFQKNLKISKKIDFIFFKRKGYAQSSLASKKRAKVPSTFSMTFLELEKAKKSSATQFGWLAAHAERGRPQRGYHHRIQIFQKRTTFFVIKKGGLFEKTPYQTQQSLAVSKILKKWRVFIFDNKQSAFSQFHANSFLFLLNRQGSFTFSPQIHYTETSLKYNFNTLSTTQLKVDPKGSAPPRVDPKGQGYWMKQSILIPNNWKRKFFSNSENIQWILKFLFFKKSQLFPNFPTKMERQKVQWKPSIFHSLKPSISLLGYNERKKQFYKKKILSKEALNWQIGVFSFLNISIFLMHLTFIKKKKGGGSKRTIQMTAAHAAEPRVTLGCKGEPEGVTRGGGYTRLRRVWPCPLDFEKFFIKKRFVISKKLIQKKPNGGKRGSHAAPPRARVLASKAAHAPRVQPPIFQLKPTQRGSSSIPYSMAGGGPAACSRPRGSVGDPTWGFFGEASFEKKKGALYFKKFWGFLNSNILINKATRGGAACDPLRESAPAGGPLLQHYNSSIQSFIFKQDKFVDSHRLFIRKGILDFYFDSYLCIMQKFYFIKNMKTRFDPLIPTKPVYFIYKKQLENQQAKRSFSNANSRSFESNEPGLFFNSTKKKVLSKKIVSKNNKIYLKKYSIRFQKSQIIPLATKLHNNTKKYYLTKFRASFFCHLPRKNLGNLYCFWIPAKNRRITSDKIKLKIFSKKRIFKTQRTQKAPSKKSQFYNFNRKNFYPWTYGTSFQVEGICPIYKKLPFLKIQTTSGRHAAEPRVTLASKAAHAPRQPSLHSIEQKTCFLKIYTVKTRTLHWDWDPSIDQHKKRVQFEIISRKKHFRCFENSIWIRYFLPVQMGEILEMILPKNREQEILVTQFSDLFSYEYKNVLEKMDLNTLNSTFDFDFLSTSSLKNRFQALRPRKNSKFLGTFLRTGEESISNQFVMMTGQMIAKTEQSILYRKAYSCLFNDQSVLYVKHGEVLLKNQRLCTVLYNQPKTGDIVQGIPKIEEIFEARKKSKYSLQKLAIFSKDFLNFEKKITQYLRSLQKSVVNNIQRIYCGQGIHISDKHIEIIVRQMTSNVWILDPGQTGLLYGEILPLFWIERINSLLNSNQVIYEPILLGMTKTCLETSSFLSAASFQETTRVLGRAALQNQIDFVRGLKQNIILGNFIPAGTGCFGRTPKLG